MTTFELYLLLQLPAIRELCRVFLVISATCCIPGAIGTVVSHGEEDLAQWRGVWKKVLYIASAVASISALGLAALPDTTTMLALVAYELGGNVEGLSAVPADLVEYLRAMLDQATAEIVGPQ